VVEAEELSDTGFLSGFAWPVPKAFSSALALCRFEEGDTFYNHPSAYLDPWGQTSPLLRYWVQVRFPPASRAVLPAESNGAAKTSWVSSAVVDISDLGNRAERKAVSTTQGRLYSLLWLGDIALLDSPDEPPCPLSWQHLHAQLPSLEERIRDAHDTGSSGGTAFVFPVDQVSTVHLHKARSVQSVLQKLAPVQVKTFDSATLLGSERYFPTIEVQSVAVATTDRDRVHSALKSLLYRPVKDSKTGADRFSLKKHGHLFAL